MAYLAAPALRYGVHHFDEQMDRFLESASDAEMEELAALAEKVRLNNHYPLVNAWLGKHPITDFKESAHLYFMFGLMDAADLQFDVAQ